jgi:electron transport complex protein RnfB
MIADAVLILGGTGLVFATFIALANRKLKVWEDPRIDAVAALLPQANCGSCGLPGCRAFAEKAVLGLIQPAKCTVSDPGKVAEIAAYLGVDAGEGVKRVARLLCAGGADVAIQRAAYRGLGTCASATTVAGRRQGLRLGVPRAFGLRAGVHLRRDPDERHIPSRGRPRQVHRLR